MPDRRDPDQRGDNQAAGARVVTAAQVIALIRARPDISRQRFHYHWRVIHSRLGLLLSDLRSYSQNHEIDPAVWGFDPSGFSGIMEAWVDTPEAAQRALTSRTYLQDVAPDEKNWMDLATTRFALTREYALTLAGNGLGSAVNAVLLLGRNGACPPDEFEETLSGVLERLAEACAGAQKISVSVFDPDSFPRPDDRYDALLKISFGSLASCEEDAAARRDALRNALADIVEVGAITSNLVEEYRFRVDGKNFVQAALQPRSTGTG